MSDIGIRVENLSKEYKIGAGKQRHDTLGDQLAESLKGLFRRNGRYSERSQLSAPSDTIWALKDVSFEVQRGEVVGVIGKNGAGKSTLLKILSRITEPTTGFVDIHGRLSSLLEVGTGFHSELTGRENIYLNGTILGMKRTEIERKFDEIVAFAEVEKFIDTPVKHYSSGMYLRLAFAVAAHLEVEILLIDEVLAVGDASFQKRCLQKMDEVSRSGRTVLFVSHNLAAIRSLCRYAIILDQGRVLGQGEANTQVSYYLAGLAERAQIPLEARTDREGNGKGRITYLKFSNAAGETVEQVFSGSPLNVVLGYQADCPGSRAEAQLSFWSAEGHKVFHVDNNIRGKVLSRLRASGEYVCSFPRLPLPPGRYSINPVLRVDDQMADHIFSAAVLEVLPGDYYGSGRATRSFGGLVYVDHDWN